MKIMLLAALAVSALSLGACNTTSSIGAYHTSTKVNGLGLFANPSVGVGAAQFSVTVDRSANVDSNGAAIKVEGGCKEDAVDTFANLNNKGSVAATSTTQAVAAAAAGASAGSPGSVSAPSVTVTTGDVTANGLAAIIAAAAQTPSPADSIARACNETVVPNAPGGTIVTQGVAPTPGAATAAAATAAPVAAAAK